MGMEDVWTPDSIGTYFGSTPGAGVIGYFVVTAQYINHTSPAADVAQYSFFDDIVYLRL